MKEKSIFIFRRDLRLEDNTGLLKAMKESKKIIPLFIFTPEQIEKNEYKSNNALQFMINSLEELENEIKERGGQLQIFKGKHEEIITNIINEINPNAIYVNKDYTPYSKERDKKIKKICKEKNVEFIQNTDYVLNGPEEILKDDGKPYTIFTPYFRKANQKEIRNPEKNKKNNFYKGNIKGDNINLLKEIKPKENHSIKVKGGRKEALAILNKIKEHNNYKQERDIPEKDATTHLSAHIKFGTISIRETYEKIKKEFGETHELIRQLYWHDFFTQISHHFPNVFRENFHKKYDKLKWDNDEKKFSAWCEGKTGFPIVDAGMRELNKTGYMHNRTRMIVASFLTKDLRIDWRWGEKYFAQKLVDYDPSVNNGSWQWAASTGCDAQPYFRIFNPWLQQKKFDPDCEYIKKWIPELKELTAKEIHNISEQNTKHRTLNSYPEPIINHKEEKEKTLEMFKNIK